MISSESPLLDVANISKTFVARRNLLGKPTEKVEAVKEISFRQFRGETVAIVGETGAGKSTVGRLVLRLIEPDSGSIQLLGQDIRALKRRELRGFRSGAQMIFQDPFGSLDPRMVIGEAIMEPLMIHTGLGRREREERAADLLKQVGLSADYLRRYPRELSGGQCQRVAIARALAPSPALIVCDEPVAALDVSIQAQVLNLLMDLQEEREMGYLFITHDLSLIRLLAHRVIVMRHGAIVESGPPEEIFTDPKEDYTKRLLASIPSMKHAQRADADRPANSIFHPAGRGRGH